MKHIRNLTLRAILAAVICVIAPFTLPAGSIPITLSLFIIFIVSACTDLKFSIPAISIYILLGAVGLPVFSGFTGGLQAVTGLTGGYIIGYMPCALVIGLICGKSDGKRFVYPLSMLAGTAVCYACGTAWYMFQQKCTFGTALAACVLPFIVSDTIKIAAASLVSIALRPRLAKILNNH